MAERIFTLPDIGEGIAEAELAEWRVRPGDLVREDDILCEVTTDKATVEIPAPFAGRVSWLAVEPGTMLAIGSPLIRIETDETVAVAEPAAVASPAPVEAVLASPASAVPASPAPTRRPEASAGPVTGASGRPLAAPSVRGRARALGINLRRVRGTGPAGRILHTDLDTFVEGGAAPDRPQSRAPREGTEAIRVTGIRRAVAERMALSKQRIPHFSIVEEVEVEALETLREGLNARHGERRGRLTILPFVLRAMAVALPDHPGLNARFDDEGGIVTRHAAMHCGIATQTEAGLMVPVLRHAEALGLWQTASEIRRLAEAARARRIAPAELSGSTITVTSLGPLGALATTPIINPPEVAIIGINRIAIRPVWTGAGFVPRRMMNLSCSFDHRVVDGWAAAEFVAALKGLLEQPALMFVEGGDE